MSAVRFIKLLFQYKQPDTFNELTKEMLHVLSVSSSHELCFNSPERGKYVPRV